MFNILRCSACCRPSRTWITFNTLLTIFEAFVPHFYLCYNHCIVPESLWIIWIVSVEECSSLTQNLIQICCSTLSVILNVTATQCTCSLNGLYHPPWPVQWSHHCSCTHIPVHSPWRPGDISVMQTIIVTMAGLVPDRPHMSLLK